MKAEAWALQASWPVAIHRQTNRPVSLAEWREEPGASVEPDDLTLEQQITLVGSRWRSGDWHDLLYGTDGEVDADRAVHEIEARSEMGLHLLAIGLRAIEMAREDAGTARDG